MSPAVPFHENPEPYETTIGHGHVVDGVIAATVALPDDPSLGPHAGKAGILFEFTLGTQRFAPVILILPEDEWAPLVELVKKAVEALPKAREWPKPRPPAGVTCPGCGSTLFHEAARRGGCFACYPELPPGGEPLGPEPEAGDA